MKKKIRIAIPESAKQYMHDSLWETLWAASQAGDLWLDETNERGKAFIFTDGIGTYIPTKEVILL
ncbi:MAG: hypothetical protein HDQ88_02330 [Clostridia bacterium]|nr:hypothetical protein [Clostridia bacterium]